MEDIVITSAVRTAVGAYLGSLKTVEAQDLGAAVIREAVRRSGLSPDMLDQVVMGEVYGYTPNVARCAALLAGVPETVPAYTVDRQCASSMQAVMSAMYELMSGEADVICAGGVESMSRMLYYLDPSARYAPLRAGDKPLYDAFAHGVTIVQPKAMYPELNMGLTAENVAAKYHITREEQDAFALDSQRKAKRAMEEGRFKDEILPFEVKERKGSFIFDTDEHPKPDTTMETLAKLKPAFKRDGTGTVTAGNASGMNDGASALIVMRASKAAALGIQPLARIKAISSAGCDPALMGLGPVYATRKALKKAGLTLEDMDLIELNEAFSTQALGCMKELGLEMGSAMYGRVNVNGGAVALGHALGNSGTRILTTLIYEMGRRKSRYGLATLCIGGGQGMACIVERAE